MSYLKTTITSSIIKKFVMALTGFVLVAFLFMHMLGNLQTFEGEPNAINAYANFLQTLPWEFLWGFRAVMALCILLHLLMGYLLVLENKAARPQKYAVKKYLAASFAARTMIYTGTVIILFVVLHLMHFTLLNIDPVFKKLEWVATSGMYEGKTIHDVYAMLVYGFSCDIVSVLYIVALAAIALHLAHAVSSMFQTIGFRNEKVRYILNKIAVLYAVVIFFGFASNPAAVLLSKYTCINIFPQSQIVEQINAQKNNDKIFVSYKGIECQKSAKAALCVKKAAEQGK